MGEEVVNLQRKMAKTDNSFRRLELRVMRMKKVQELYHKMSSQEDRGVKKFSDEYIIRCIEDQVFVMGEYIWKILQGHYEKQIQEYEQLKANINKPEPPLQQRLQF